MLTRLVFATILRVLHDHGFKARWITMSYYNVGGPQRCTYHCRGLHVRYMKVIFVGGWLGLFGGLWRVAALAYVLGVWRLIVLPVVICCGRVLCAVFGAAHRELLGMIVCRLLWLVVVSCGWRLLTG